MATVAVTRQTLTIRVAFDGPDYPQRFDRYSGRTMNVREVEVTYTDRREDRSFPFTVGVRVTGRHLLKSGKESTTDRTEDLWNWSYTAETRDEPEWLEQLVADNKPG